MAWTQTELDALKKAYASGTLRIRFDDKSVEYGSEADLLRRIRVIEREIRASIGNGQSHRSLSLFFKG